MAQQIVIASQKGGVGKTTVCLNLALAFAERGVNTLLVDLDPQGAIGLSLGQKDTAWPGIADLMMGVVPKEKTIVRTKLPLLSILARGRLDPRDICEYETALYSTNLLSDTLKKVEGGFDLLILDTPGGMGMITRAILRIAEFVLVPVQAEVLAGRSTPQIRRIIEHVQKSENPGLRFLGFLATMVEHSDKLSQSILMQLWSSGANVLQTVIPRNRVFHEACQKGIPVGYLGATVHPEARRFDMLAIEVENLIHQYAEESDSSEEMTRTERTLI